MSQTLSQLGWDETLASAYRVLDRPDSLPGRVLRADRGVCSVMDADGVLRASLAGSVLLGAARDPALLPCAGDWVVLRRWPDRRTTVECVLPRRTALIRRTADKDSTGQVLAANMDTVAVVEPIHPEPDDARVERLLALAWAVFGGASGDSTFKSGKTTYRAYAAYRAAVGFGGLIPSDANNVRLLTDAQFAGQ